MGPVVEPWEKGVHLLRLLRDIERRPPEMENLSYGISVRGTWKWA